MTPSQARAKVDAIAAVANNFDMIQVLANEPFNGRATAAELADAMENSRQTAYYRILRLVHSGVVLPPVHRGGNYTLLADKFDELAEFLSDMGFPIFFGIEGDVIDVEVEEKPAPALIDPVAEPDDDAPIEGPLDGATVLPQAQNPSLHSIDSEVA